MSRVDAAGARSARRRGTRAESFALFLALVSGAVIGRAFAAEGDVPATAPPPLEAFGRLPAIEDVEISPDAKLVALTTTQDERRVIVVKRVADGETIGALNAGDGKVRDLEWAGSKYLIVTTSRTGGPIMTSGPRGEWLSAVSFDVHSHQQDQLLKDIPNAINAVVVPPRVRVIDGRALAYALGLTFPSLVDASTSRIGLFRIDLATMKTTPLQAGPNTYDWLVDDQGKPIATATFDRTSGHWAIEMERRGRWQPVKTIDNAIELPDIVGLGRDGRSVLLLDPGDGTRALREFPLDADDWNEPLASGGQLVPLFDPVTHAMAGYRQSSGDDGRYTFYSSADAAMWQAIVAAYPGQGPELASWSDDRRHVIVRVDSPTTPPAYAYVDLDTRAAKWIGRPYPDASSSLAKTIPIEFKASDGLPITGYLTLPRERPATNLPLVVLPHGGPAARDSLRYDWWTQAIASRGYAVLRVNYRGSDGFDRELLRAGYGQWGRKMESDLTDGVRYLAEQGRIDPKRVCIVGASYGGYAALAGAAFVGAYRCAAAVAGPSDMHRFVAWARVDKSAATQRYLLALLGTDDPNDPVLERISPALHVENVTVPILLIHGKDDTVVPFEQTQIMADALARAGKPYQLVVLDHEDHWLSRSDTRLQMLRAVMDFLQRNNPAD